MVNTTHKLQSTRMYRGYHIDRITSRWVIRELALECRSCGDCKATIDDRIDHGDIKDRSE